ncbi:MAG: nucleotidyltransferase, partial [Oscillospiraceae bacterium]
ELLRQAKQKATLPIIMKPVQIKELDAYAQRIFELECASTDIYTLAMPTPLPCGMEMTENVVRI